MGRGNAVIDIDIDPFVARTARWRTLLRIGVPVLGVALIIALILAITIYADRANRRGALALSEDVLTALDVRISVSGASLLCRSALGGSGCFGGPGPGQ